ncbi:MAG: hypothetical protein MUF48_24330 [Pirellulaceae bacterium]|jgi:hypothetical protein|nr:hypothetical protein [Pirellulaceae bacterium]
MLWTLVVAAALGPGDPASFRVGIELPSQLPVTPAVEHALRDLGVGFVNFYVANRPSRERPEAETTAALIALCERLGLDFALACHHRDPQPSSVQAGAASRARFEGVVFDELAHIRLLHPEFAPAEGSELLADPTGFRSLPEAWQSTHDALVHLAAKTRDAGAPRVVATHVWPNLLHTAARAGFTPCPKICKEFYSPVSLAVGLGAALQYGRDLWVDCDMWYFQLIPGHPPAEVESNLLLAYWLGADLVYLEGAGYNLLPAGRQGTPFALVNVVRENRYQLTPHGEMLKRFCRTYLPSHHRPWTFRDVRPDVAIVRFEDGDFGQVAWQVPGLYGSRTLQGDDDTRAWLALWNVLTRGRTGGDALAYFKLGPRGPRDDPRHHDEVTPSYASDPDAAALHPFFVPLRGVVVFDDQVDYDRLREIPVLFPTGKQLSGQTVAAIRRCVEEGAVCVAWGPLAVRSGLAGQWNGGVSVVPTGKGRFVLTDDFAAPEAVAEYQAWLAQDDEIRYRFGRYTVTLRRAASDNEVTVHVDPPLAVD